MGEYAILNLGIYSTDIGYLSSYEKTQESLNYLRQCSKLADNVGLSDSFSPELLEEFEEKIENRDELAELVNETIADAEDYLKDDDRTSLAALLIAGSFVEGLYLSTQIVNNASSSDLPAEVQEMLMVGLVKTIVDQEQPLGDLIEMLKAK